MTKREETNTTQQVRPWVDELATLMDSKFRVPGTSIRFGLDPVIGLIPGVGDTATLMIGVAMFAEAYRLRLGSGVMARMAINLVIDWLAGLVPGVDIVLDTAVKAHSKNARLLKRAAADRGSAAVAK
ncbi:MAG: hypothetical protein CMJ31_01155 [Phycisphaerae bacterium]|nr:hypothetical protein [Phycisphaerae bacterium]